MDRGAFPRVHLLTRTDLGDCLVVQARADEAVAASGKALDMIGGMARTQPGHPGISPRTSRYLPAQRRAWRVRALEQRMRHAHAW